MNGEKIEQVREAARYVNAHDFISRLPKGYDNEVLERGATLSTGQKQLLAFAEQVSLPTHVLLTKTDKLKRGRAAKALIEVRRDLGNTATVQHFSALTRLGEDEARSKLDEFLTLSMAE